MQFAPVRRRLPLVANYTCAVSCERITKKYRNGSIGALDVSLELPRGKVTGFLGPNGAGKSTMVNILTTAIRPTTGRFLVEGLDGAKDRDEIRRIIGVVSQDFAVDWALTVFQHLVLFAQISGRHHSHAQTEVREWLEVFDLSDKADTKILQLSGGQGRRVQLIRCLMASLPVVFVDEPTLGLDPKGVDAVLRSLRQMADRGACVVMASNAMDQVESGCDDVVFMKQGRLVDKGSVQYFLDRYGGPEMVVLTVLSEGRPRWSATHAGTPNTEEIAPHQWQLSFSVPEASGAVPLLTKQASDDGLNLIGVTTRPKSLRSIYLGMGSASQEGML